MISERRNELIAELFHRVHFIEKWGRGISLILSREPDADFKEVGTHFIAVFRRKGLEGTTPKTTPKTDDKIVTLIRHNPSLTKKELAKLLNISLDGVKYHIRKLRKKRVIEWKGPDRGGHWEILEEAEK